MPKVNAVQGMVPQSTIKPLSAPEMPRTPSLAAFGGGGQGMTAFGNGLEKLAGAMGDIAQANAESDAREADTAFAKDVREVMLNPDGGFMTRKGSDAVGAAGGVDEYIAERRKYYAGNLDSLARQKFDQWADRRMEVNGNAIANHTMREQQTVNMGNAKARIESLSTDAAMNYFNPRVSNEYLAAAEKEVINLANMQGLGSDQVKVELDNLHSGYARWILEDAAKTRTKDFEAYHRQLSGKLRGNDAAQIDHLKRGIEQKNTINTATATLLQNSTKPNFAAADGLVQAMIATESSGNPNAVSSKGALGMMQIMPETGRDIFNKLKAEGKVDGEFSPELLKDPRINIMFGREYINQQLGKYQGNSLMALAAYNWGPGRVDALVKQLGGLGNFSNEEFYNALPDGRGKEGYTPENDVQSYVRKTLGTVPMGEADMANMAQSLTGGNFEMSRDVVANVKLIRGSQEKQVKAQQDAVFNHWSMAIESGQPYSAIPFADKEALSHEMRNSLRDLSISVAEGRTLPRGGDDYNSLQSMALRNPADFASVDLRHYVGTIPKAELDELVKMQQNFNTRGFVDDTQSQAVTAGLSLLQPKLMAAGIDYNAKKDSDEKNESVAFDAAYKEMVRAWINQHKKEPDDKTLVEIGNRLLAKHIQEINWRLDRNVSLYQHKGIESDDVGAAVHILNLSGRPDSSFARVEAMTAADKAKTQLESLGIDPTNERVTQTAAGLLAVPEEDWAMALRDSIAPYDILEWYKL